MCAKQTSAIKLLLLKASLENYSANDFNATVFKEFQKLGSGGGIQVLRLDGKMLSALS